MACRSRLFRIGLAALLLGSAVGHAQSLRDWRGLAARMVDEEIASAGVTNERVLRAMRETPRHEFVPANERRLAYFDMALPIGHEQTISPPFVVAYMTQEIDPQPTDRVLEIGTGSGYQAAVLSPLVRDVYTIEIVEPLGKRAARTLKRLGYKNVHVKVGDGYQGWPEHAPFDKIIVTCSPEQVPKPLVDQLRDGGLMIVPVGERYQQNLYLFRKRGDKLESEALKATLFVPMTGQAETRRAVLPDPANPTIANGSFEKTLDDEPAGWHYQRQLTLENNPSEAPDGRRFVSFRNDEPGRAAHALQGLAVDGRKVSKLRLDFSVRGRNIQSGQEQSQWPFIIVTFYDGHRAMIEEARVGPFHGSFDWRADSREFAVPLRAREAIVRIGLLGAVGELSLDNLRLSAAP